MKITPLPELTPMLKQLRLSGLLDSLDARNREAIEKKLTYPEFLALVIQDEAGRREQKKYGMRLRRAGFRGERYSLLLTATAGDWSGQVDRFGVYSTPQWSQDLGSYSTFGGALAHIM